MADSEPTDEKVEMCECNKREVEVRVCFCKPNGEVVDELRYCTGCYAMDFGSCHAAPNVEAFE